MNQIHDHEEDLRRTLSAVATAVREPHNFTERMLSAVTHPAATSRGSRGVRTFAPLLAAAAVLALVLGITALLSAGSRHHAAPANPGPRVVKSGPVGTPLPASFRAADVSFADSEHGWALGNAACAGGSCATVARTDDGGAHWVALPAPKSVTPVNDAGSPTAGSCNTNGNIVGPCVNRIVFADRLHGYLFSIHSLYMTVDGGATWTDLHTRVVDLVIAGGYAYRTTSIHDCSGTCTGAVEVAKLGQTTWHTLISGVDTLQVRMATSGQSVYFLGTGDSDRTLHRSSDGATWSVRSADPCGRQQPTLISAASDGAVAVTCASGASLTTRISTDGGATFGAPRDLSSAAAARAGAGTEDLQLYGFEALSANNLRACVWTTSSVCLDSTDGGSTWQVAEKSAQTALTRFTSATDGYRFVGDTAATFQVTHDGGRTWSGHHFG